MKLALMTTTAFGLFGLLIVYLFTEQILGLFSADMQYLAVGKHAIRIMLLGMPLVGLNVVSMTLFQALGKARPSFILSQQTDPFPDPACYYPTEFFQAGWGLAAYPILDTLSFFLSVYLILRVHRTFKEHPGSSGTGTISEVAVSSGFE